MMRSEISDSSAMVPHLHGTLWRCDHCNLFVSIHSAEIVQQAFCPACGAVPLEFCGTVTNMLGLQFADA